MPFTASGIRPDIVINTCCIPSRMTIGQLLEGVVSKSAALQGHTIETTQYERVDMNEIGDVLESHGFERHGLETMYCGFTGKKMEAQIFICPTYYLRLKHLVQDKIHSRARGPVTLLTRQPPEGRSRDGGLRFGESRQSKYKILASLHVVGNTIKLRGRPGILMMLFKH
jgi:DNA-directed RNA polymerase II subunit RPB2